MTGAAGVAGATGATGAAGPVGPVGATGAAGPGDLTGTTGLIGGSALLLGGCATGTATVAGAVKGHRVAAVNADGSLFGGGFKVDGAVVTAGTVTVEECAIVAGTPPAKAMNVYVSVN